MTPGGHSGRTVPIENIVSCSVEPGVEVSTPDASVQWSYFSSLFLSVTFLTGVFQLNHGSCRGRAQALPAVTVDPPFLSWGWRPSFGDWLLHPGWGLVRLARALPRSVLPVGCVPWSRALGHCPHTRSREGAGPPVGWERKWVLGALLLSPRAPACQWRAGVASDSSISFGPCSGLQPSGNTATVTQHRGRLALDCPANRKPVGSPGPKARCLVWGARGGQPPCLLSGAFGAVGPETGVRLAPLSSRSPQGQREEGPPVGTTSTSRAR